MVDSTRGNQNSLNTKYIDPSILIFIRQSNQIRSAISTKIILANLISIFQVNEYQAVRSNKTKPGLHLAPNLNLQTLSVSLGVLGERISSSKD